jgi:DNA-binding transcriptional LysR family regulator
MHMNDLRALRHFLAVSDLGSFAAAARQAGTTPASVTRAIAGLEEVLGVQLFVRTTRRVALTSAGAAYLARLRPILDEFDSATEEARGAGASRTGLIRIHAPLSLGQRVLPQVLSDFRATHPQIDLSLILSDEFVQILGADADLAIRISQPPTDKSTIWRKICRVDRVLVTRPDDAAAAARHPQDLDPDRLWGYSPDGRPETWDLSGKTARRSLRAGKRLRVNNGEVLADMVLRDGGVALLPRFIVDAALAAGQLVTILPDWRPPEIWLTLYYPPYDRLPPRIATFSDFFEHHVTVRHPLSGVLSAGS